MINRAEAQLKQLVVHHLGKQSESEDIIFSKSGMSVEDTNLHQQLLKYFLDGFKEPDFFTFTFNDGDFVLNPMYNYLGNIFDDPDSMYEHSIKIARLLHSKSTSPLIKSGDLVMVYIADILVDDEMVDAIGIFKSEDKDPFFKVMNDDGTFYLDIEEGISMNKLDKACLILNTDRDIGFKIINIDHSNRNNEARYWRDDFLILEARTDDYHATTHMIRMTAEFVKKKMPKENEVDKVEEAQYMNKSAAYFNNNESFSMDEYAGSLFEDEHTRQAFEEFTQEKKSDNHWKEEDAFAISEYAVKKQAKVFKSVIKLDKNFHIYVHGDHSKITKGQLDNGQKYYMLYYDDEA